MVAGGGGSRTCQKVVDLLRQCGNGLSLLRGGTGRNGGGGGVVDEGGDPRNQDIELQRHPVNLEVGGSECTRRHLTCTILLTS
jgi:hypothetical protein